jgi:hypothetical protein
MLSHEKRIHYLDNLLNTNPLETLSNEHQRNLRNNPESCKRSSERQVSLVGQALVSRSIGSSLAAPHRSGEGFALL